MNLKTMLLSMIGEMSDEVKQLMAERIKTDWESERKLLSQRKVKILGFYDEYVKGIMN